MARPVNPEIKIRRLIQKKKFSEAKAELEKVLPKFGEREGQSIKFLTDAVYSKGGQLHFYDLEKDARIRSVMKRKPGSATWRGDLPGSMI